MDDNKETLLEIILHRADNTETLLEIILDEIANKCYEKLPSKVGIGPKL